ncbi:MAG: amidase family protein [Nitrospinota bacterium]|nr:amidase family protein [Nitrospinota bacterium]
MTNFGRVVDDRLSAFCRDSDAYLEGAAEGPLAGLTFTAKDIFVVAGHVTGGGNPDWKATHGPAEKTARAVSVLVEAGATMAGKTITDELTRGIFGEIAHYDTPVNPRAPGRVPAARRAARPRWWRAGLWISRSARTRAGRCAFRPASAVFMAYGRPTGGFRWTES